MFNFSICAPYEVVGQSIINNWSMCYGVCWARSDKTRNRLQHSKIFCTVPWTMLLFLCVSQLRLATRFRGRFLKATMFLPHPYTKYLVLILYFHRMELNGFWGEEVFSPLKSLRIHCFQLIWVLDPKWHPLCEFEKNSLTP